MDFPPLGNSDHVVVSVSIDFPSNSTQNVLFHHIVYGFFQADWDGLCNCLRNVPWEDVFKLGASAAISELCEWVQVGFMCISLILSIRPNLTHLHGFQLIVLLP